MQRASFVMEGAEYTAHYDGWEVTEIHNLKTGEVYVTDEDGNRPNKYLFTYAYNLFE
jgi:hypothetical protein